MELRFPTGFSSVRVTIEKDASKGNLFVGSAHASHPQRAPFSRTMRSQNCEELTNALILTLEIEADAIRKSLVTAPEEVIPPPPPPKVVDRDPLTAHGSLALGIGLSSGYLPAVTPELAFIGQFGWEAQERVVRPRLRIGGIVSLGMTRSVDPYTTSFSAIRGVLDLCPIAFGRPQAVEFSPCLRQEVGAIQAAGEGFEGAQKSTEPLLSTGGAVIVRVHTSTEALWFLGADVSMVAPWFRHRYAVGSPPVEAHRLAGLLPSIMLSFGISTK